MRTWIKLAALGAGLLFAGLLAAWSGLFPLGAASGHWAPTEWLLQMTKRRTVKVRSSRIPVPEDLEQRARILRGAGHYEAGCRACHGSPGTRPPVVLRYMTPDPPLMLETASDLEPEELFWIVKNGIKLTGMPGWPSLPREDEVWDVVAFLRQLPGMTPSTYRELAGLDLEVPADAPREARTCARCHGTDGRGRDGAAPRIAGQSVTYLYCGLRAYFEVRRASGIMETVASQLSDSQMRELARYYGSLSPGAPSARAPGSTEPGEEIALRGVPARKVPSCSDCHGPSTHRRKPAYPRLAGQNEPYLLLQLDLFRRRVRGGSPFAHLMDPVSENLTVEQGEQVARYYASLPAEPAFDEPPPTWDVCDAE